MKIICMVKDELWRNVWRDKLSPESRIVREEQDWKSASADVRLVHNDAIEFERFCEYVESRTCDSRLVVIVSGDDDQIRTWTRYCLSRDIRVWVARIGHSARQLADLIVRELDEEGRHSSRDEDPTIVMFTGSTPNIGTTVVAYGTALSLANQTESSIAYLCLNLKSSKIHHYLGMNQPAVSLDGLRADLKTGSLTPHRLRQYFQTTGVPNLHVLFGNMYREQAEFYSTDDMRHLLDVARETFDCCIVDVNAYWDNAATVCTALSAGIRIAVTSNRLACFQEDVVRGLMPSIALFDLPHDCFDLFVVSDASGASYRMRDIRKETGLNVIGQMRSYSDLNRFLDQGKLNDFYEAHPQSVKDLSGPVRTIMSLAGLAKKPAVPVGKTRLYRARLFNH